MTGSRAKDRVPERCPGKYYIAPPGTQGVALGYYISPLQGFIRILSNF